MSIFSEIAAGRIPSYRVAADDSHYAFLDINPIVEGHTLVIPRREEDYIFDLSDDELASLIAFAKRVAEGIKSVYGCKKVGMAVLGLEVPHAHIHLIPLHSEGDLDFRRPKLKLPADEMESIARRLRQAIEG